MPFDMSAARCSLPSRGCGARAVTRIIHSAVGAETLIDGVRHVNFGGSSYLGLSSHPQIIEAGVAALVESGSGYQFPRNYQIATRAHEEVETVAASFFGTQTALYLANGYGFGLTGIAALCPSFNVIFFDERAHYALRDAIAASGLRNHAFRHVDAEDLELQLKRHLRAGERPLVVTDGMYSTFGEIAPLDQLARAMAPYAGRLLVDESHSFGVLGDSGRGAAEQHHIPAAQFLSGGSTGKALGVLGGIVPASEIDKAALCRAPAARGAAAGMPAAAAMCAASLSYIRQHPELLQRLRSNICYMKEGMRRLGLPVGDSIAPVASFSCGSWHETRALQERLMTERIFVFHSTYIGAGETGVIRCGIFADHTLEHIDVLLNALRRLL